MCEKYYFLEGEYNFRDFIQGISTAASWVGVDPKHYVRNLQQRVGQYTNDKGEILIGIAPMDGRSRYTTQSVNIEFKKFNLLTVLKHKSKHY